MILDLEKHLLTEESQEEFINQIEFWLKRNEIKNAKHRRHNTEIEPKDVPIVGDKYIIEHAGHFIHKKFRTKEEAQNAASDIVPGYSSVYKVSNDAWYIWIDAD